MQFTELWIDGKPSDCKHIRGIGREKASSASRLSIQIKDSMQSIGINTVKFQEAIKTLLLNKYCCADILAEGP